MSIRTEWIDVDHPALGLDLRTEGQHWNRHVEESEGLEPGEAAEDAIPTEVGLVICGDDAVILTGTAAGLRQRLTEALRLLDREVPVRGWGASAERQWGDSTEDVRPYARARALAMLSLYAGRSIDQASDPQDEAEPLTDLLSDLLHLAAGYDAIREGERTVLDAALSVFHDENRAPGGLVAKLPGATVAAAAAL